MAFILLALLLLFSFFSVLFMHRRKAFVLIGLSLSWTAVVGSGWLPSRLLAELQTHAPLAQPEWKNKNAIIVLGAGTARWPQNGQVSSPVFGYSRVSEAARLYHDCKSKRRDCRIVPSGGDPLKNGVTEAEVMRRELKGLGVADADIFLESKSNNTFQNAQFTAGILKTNPSDQTVLVTSGVHLKRSLLYFSHFQMTPIGAPSDQLNAPLSWVPRSLNFTLMDLALHEVTGVLRFHAYNLLGLNKKP